MLLIMDNATEFCSNTKELFEMLGIFVTIIKIVIPLALIIFGMLDMGKAVTSGKEDEIKKQVVTFIKRAIGAVLVFFVPTIVGLLMQFINNSTHDPDACGYSYCVEGITGVAGKCKKS